MIEKVPSREQATKAPRTCTGSRFGFRSTKPTSAAHLPGTGPETPPRVPCGRYLRSPETFSNPTAITSFRVNGANVVITGTNGQAGDAYYLLESTNVALPLSQWKVVATNVLGANGNYTFNGTNVVTPGDQQQFYILSNTNSYH